jgi:amidase
MSWETIASQKRDALKASIPTEWVIPADILPPDTQADVTGFPKESGWFTERELEITSTPAPQILLNIATGSWSSEEVTRVFCKAAAAAHQLVYPFNELSACTIIRDKC